LKEKEWPLSRCPLANQGKNRPAGVGKVQGLEKSRLAERHLKVNELHRQIVSHNGIRRPHPARVVVAVVVTAVVTLATGFKLVIL